MSGCKSCSGRLFHSVGPEMAKQLSPNWLRDLLTKHVHCQQTAEDGGQQW